MHIRFHSISIQRFRSFNKQQILFFDEMGSGLYFLKGKNLSSSALGSNGAGKSTVIDALLWCLYGKTVQGLKNPDIIPWSGKGKTKVEVTIFVDKTKHVIKRTANPNHLSINGKEAGQEYVSKLIAIPFEIIPYTIILGQRQPLFFDLTASEKLKLFSEVLNLDRWELRSNHASELAKSLDNEISIKESELSSLENAQKQAVSDLNSLKLQSAAWEAERADKLLNAENDKKALQTQIQSVSNNRDTADLKLDRALTELKAIKPALEKLRIEERSSTTIANEANRTLHTLSFEKKALLEKLEVVDEGLCPTCNQPLSDKKHAQTLQKTTKKSITEIDAKIKTTIVAVKKAEEAYSKIETAIDAQLAAKEQFESDAEEARDILDRLVPKMERWKSEIAALERAAKDSENSDNPYAEQLQTMRRRRDQHKEAAVQTERSIKTKTEYCERVKFWIKGFKDIKLLSIEEILMELELNTSGMLEEFGLVNWKIKYDIERENKSGNITKGLNITVLSPYNKNAVKWESWSGGESQRLRLVGTEALASVLLNHVGISTNLSIYDEPTTGLSKEGIQDLVELLAQRAKGSKKSIFLVDHHTVSSSKFVQTIQVTKDKQGSFLEIV